MQAHTYEGNPLRILIVEDSYETRELFSVLFTAMGYLVKATASPSEAITIAAEFRPDAIFSAIFLGYESGFDLCSRFRQMPETAQSLIVAVTGLVSPKCNCWVHDAEFDKYLIKPVDIDTLLQTLCHLPGYRGHVLPLSAPLAQS